MKAKSKNMKSEIDAAFDRVENKIDAMFERLEKKTIQSFGAQKEDMLLVNTTSGAITCSLPIPIYRRRGLASTEVFTDKGTGRIYKVKKTPQVSIVP